MYSSDLGLTNWVAKRQWTFQMVQNQGGKFPAGKAQSGEYNCGTLASAGACGILLYLRAWKWETEKKEHTCLAKPHRCGPHLLAPPVNQPCKTKGFSLLPTTLLVNGFSTVILVFTWKYFFYTKVAMRNRDKVIHSRRNLFFFFVIRDKMRV